MNSANMRLGLNHVTLIKFEPLINYEVYPIQNVPVDVTSLILNIQTSTLYGTKGLNRDKKPFNSKIRTKNISYLNFSYK